MTARPGIPGWRIAVGATVVSAAARSTVGVDTSLLLWNVLQFGSLAYLAIAGAVVRPGRDAGRAVPRSMVLAMVLYLALAVGATVRIGGGPSAERSLLWLLLTFLAIGGTMSRRWRDRDQIASDLRWLAWLIVWMHAVGLVGHFTHATWAIPDTDLGRYRGIYFNANYAGLTAALGLLLLVALRRSRRLDIAAATFLAVAVVFSGSRGGASAAIAGGLVLIVLPSTRARMFIGAWFLALAAGVSALFNLGWFSFLQSFVDRVRDSSDFTSGRSEIYASLLAKWHESPIFGIGFNNAFLTEFDPSVGGRGVYVVLGHNTFLTVLVETGILGLIAFVFLIVTIKVAAAPRDPLLAVFVAVLVYELTESALLGIANPVAVIEWLCLAGYAATGVTRRLRPNAPAVDPVVVESRT